jgi:type I restriction enzyme S subunit
MKKNQHTSIAHLAAIRKETCSPHDCTGVYIGLEHIDPSRFSLTRHGNPADVRSAKARFYPGDVLYGKLRPYLDKAVVAESEGICSTDILVLEPREVPAWYLCGILHTDRFVEHAKQTTHGVNHPRTSWAGINVFETATFDSTEQKKIAAVLLKIQRAIETQDKIIQSLRDLKKSTMQHLFTHGLRGEKTKMTEFGPIPANWRIEILRDCATVQTGVAKGRKIAEHEALELPYLRVANVQDGHLDLTEMKTIRLRQSERSRFSLQDGDVVLTEGGDFDKLGRGFVWEGQIPDCVHQNHVFAVRADCKLLRPHFLAYLAQSSYGKAYFLKIAHKTTNLACINTTKLKRLPVPIPDRAEQDEIVASISTVDARTFHHESKKASLQDLFKTTLNKLMTGDIRVADLDIDVKEVEVCPERGVLNG